MGRQGVVAEGGDGALGREAKVAQAGLHEALAEVRQHVPHLRHQLRRLLLCCGSCRRGCRCYGRGSLPGAGGRQRGKWVAVLRVLHQHPQVLQPRVVPVRASDPRAYLRAHTR